MMFVSVHDMKLVVEVLNDCDLYEPRFELRQSEGIEEVWLRRDNHADVPIDANTVFPLAIRALLQKAARFKAMSRKETKEDEERIVDAGIADFVHELPGD